MMNNKFLLLFFFFVAVIGCSSSSSDVHELKGRGLKSFKETAIGTNITFDCSPSGPCLPCFYHEKKDVSYRCSETGYRIPMKCLKTATAADEENQTNNNNNNNNNNKLDDSSQTYLTYRSCIPPLNQQNLTLLSFEAIMLLLLITSSFVIFRRKGTFLIPGPGAIRLPTNPRF